MYQVATIENKSFQEMLSDKEEVVKLSLYLQCRLMMMKGERAL